VLEGVKWEEEEKGSKRRRSVEVSRVEWIGTWPGDG
jgi:hypothetical protein